MPQTQESPVVTAFFIPESKRTRSLRERKHNYILPKVKTERFKRVYVNRCLFEL